MTRIVKDRRGIRRKDAIIDAVLSGLTPQERTAVEKRVRELGLAESRRTARDYIASHNGYVAVSLALGIKP